MKTEKYIGESKLSEQPKKKLTLIIDDKAVTTAKIADQAVTTEKLSGEDDEAGAAVVTSKIADSAVTTKKIEDGAVTTDKLSGVDDPEGAAVTTEKIANSAVNGDKLAQGSVMAMHIAENAVESKHLTLNSVMNIHIKENAVTEGKIASGAVTTDKLSGGVYNGVLTPPSVTDDKIAAGAVTNEKIAVGAVTEGKIYSGAVTNDKLAPNAVVAGNIAAGAVQAGNIVEGAITAGKIAANAVVEGNIAENAVTTAKIKDGNVTTGKILDGNVTEAKLADGAVTMAKLADDTISRMETITDATPTEGSVKPIQSGGVQVALMDRAIVGDIVGDPAQEWEPGTAEAYIDQKIAEQNAVLNAKISRQDAVIHTLNGQDIVLVSALPQTGEANKIYRLTGADSYTDYMWDASLATPAFTAIATYGFPGIDEEPTAYSDNLVKSNGVLKNIAFVNVNTINNLPNTPYETAVAARTAVPTKYRTYGIMFCYLLADGWHVEQYVGNNPTGWAVETSTLWKEYDYKKEHLIYNVNYNPNAQSSNTRYTLAEAIAAVPDEYRCIARAITYWGKDGFGHLAIFNVNSFRTNFTNEKYWTDFSQVLLNDLSIGKIGGVVSDNLTCEAPATRTFLVGDATDPGILIDDDKFFFNVLDSDSYGFWKFYVFYDDGTKAFSSIVNGKNEFAKKVRGISICVNANSNSCFLNYRLYTHIRYDIHAIEDDIIALQNRTYTAAEVGAVGIAQGIENVGKSLIVGSNGDVTLGEPSPIGNLEGYGKIQSTIKLYLKADIAEEVSVGAGWSGNLTDGYTHATGNTDTLVLGHTETDKKYLVTINFSDLSENTLEVKIGNGYAVDPYNGTTQSSVGFISDGGDLIVTPNSSYTGTIRVKLQEVTDAESAAENITLTIDNFDAGQLADNISGFWNTALGGDNTMIHIQNASRNIALGNKSLANLISGSRNIGVGTFSLAQLRYGKGNIGIGADTYYRRQSGDDNVAIGRACMGGATESVNNNTCVGRSAGERVTGDDNVCIGTTAGYAVTSGNVCIGLNAGFSHNAGVNNIFIGRNAGYSGTQRTGAWNTALGPSASISNNVSKSVAIGFQAHATKSSQNVIGCETSVETKVYGDLVVHGTDGIDRKIVFNQDGTVSWEQV